MNSKLQERVYHSVETAVLWGEPREEVFRIMDTNGINGPDAEAVFRRAWAERMSILRGAGFRLLIKGLVIMSVAGGAFAVFWYGFGGINRLVFILCGGGAIWGTWLSADGLSSILLAPLKRGSVLDET